MSDLQQKSATETPVANTPAQDSTMAAVDPTSDAKPGSIKEDKPAEITAVTEDKPKDTTEAKEAKPKEVKETEPITSGPLGYKAPGLVKGFIFSKKYFWLGDAPVTNQNLSRYLRGEKPEVSHPTAAWSSQTGKGLLYFVKHADEKANPVGVLNLSEASDIVGDGLTEISMKLNNHKHSFQATGVAQRDGWLLALQKAAEDAKAAREEIVNSEGYKEAIKHLDKPSVMAAATPAKTESTPKKSTEIKPAEGVARDNASSSSSSDEEKKKKEKKSRSVSRGKRGSIFGNLLGKKEEKEEKKEEKKEDEVKKEPEQTKPEPAVADVSATAPAVDVVIPTEPSSLEPQTIEEARKDEPKEEPKEFKEEAKAEPTKPKASKRGSIFGSFFEKVKSPANEKKESEVGPVPPPKDSEPETTTKPETSAPEITPAPVVTRDVAPALSDAEEITVEEYKKEESKDEPKEEPKLVTKPETTTTKTPDTKEKRRSSFFGSFGTMKKEKKPTNESEGETTEGEKEKKSPVPKLGGLFRNPSKAMKGNKETKKEETPAKVEPETPAESKEETIETPVAESPTAAEEQKPKEEPKASIGDVVPEAVTVGQAQPTAPVVQASA